MREFYTVMRMLYIFTGVMFIKAYEFVKIHWIYTENVYSWWYVKPTF